jgi:toxin ParE1/3/4
MARINLTDPARDDIDTVLAKSREVFSTVAQKRYSALIRAAFRDLAANPLRIGSKELAGSRPGLRAYHLANSRGRVADSSVRNPRHLIIYRLNGTEVVEILRILHDAMDPDRHLP